MCRNPKYSESDKIFQMREGLKKVQGVETLMTQLSNPLITTTAEMKRIINRYALTVLNSKGWAKISGISPIEAYSEHAEANHMENKHIPLCNYCHKMGHLEKDCHTKQKDIKSRVTFHSKKMKKMMPMTMTMVMTIPYRESILTVNRRDTARSNAHRRNEIIHLIL